MSKTVLSSLVLCGLLSGACVIAIEDPAPKDNTGPRFIPKEPEPQIWWIRFSGEWDGDIMISGTAENKVEIYAQHGRKAAPSAGIHFIGSWLSQPDVHVRTTPDSVRVKTGESGYGEEAAPSIMS